jgi:hypothetical protein
LNQSGFMIAIVTSITSMAAAIRSATIIADAIPLQIAVAARSGASYLSLGSSRPKRA